MQLHGENSNRLPTGIFLWCVMQIHSCSFGSTDWTQDLWISECNALIARTGCVHKLNGCRWLINLRASLPPPTEEWNCGLCVSILGLHKRSKSPSSLWFVSERNNCPGTDGATEPSIEVSEEGRRSPSEGSCLLLSAWRAETTREGIWVLLM